MKQLMAVFITLSLFFIGIQTGFTDIVSQPPNAVKTETQYPIAAGIWYPQNGPIPDKPMRYYRVRCWPGCHSGSALGKYPKKELTDSPIYPTSTVGAHTAGKSRNYK